MESADGVMFVSVSLWLCEINVSRTEQLVEIGDYWFACDTDKAYNLSYLYIRLISFTTRVGAKSLLLFF